MENFIGLLGIISLCLVGVLAQTADVDYSKPDDMTVRILTTNQQVMPGQKNVNLSCMGWSDNLGDYIANRICWSFVKYNGERLLYTEGFYPTTKLDPKSVALVKKFKDKEYDIGYNDTKYFIFTMTIAEVKPSDDGEYICELWGAADPDKPVNTQSTSLTVLNQVEKVTLEVHDKDTHQVLIKKTKPADEKDAPVELAPGKYMIDCAAVGSNPAPEMKFMYNEEIPSVLVTTLEDTAGDRRQFSGNVRFPQFHLKAMGAKDQYLTCTANIPGNLFQPKIAGVKVHVKVDKPTMECKNASKFVEDAYGKLECNVTAAGSKCDMIKWIIGDTDTVIGSNDAYGDQRQTYDLINTHCQADSKNPDVLQVYLEVNQMKASHFTTVFYLSYGIGNDAHREPVQFILKDHDSQPDHDDDDDNDEDKNENDDSGSGVITPLSLLVYLALALVSRQVMQRF